MTPEKQEILLKFDGWRLDSAVEKIIDRNIKEIPWEGTEVNRYAIKEEILEMFEELKKALDFPETK